MGGKTTFHVQYYLQNESDEPQKGRALNTYTQIIIT